MDSSIIRSNEKCLITRYDESMVQRFALLANDEEVSRNLLLVPYPYTEQDAIDWITKIHDPLYNFAICTQEDAQRMVIGTIGIKPNHLAHAKHVVEIG